MLAAIRGLMRHDELITIAWNEIRLEGVSPIGKVERISFSPANDQEFSNRLPVVLSELRQLTFQDAP